jgi:hypothetical protein
VKAEKVPVLVDNDEPEDEEKLTITEKIKRSLTKMFEIEDQKIN